MHVVLKVCLALNGLQSTLAVGAGAASVCGPAGGGQFGIGMVVVEMLSRPGCCFGSAVNAVEHGGQGREVVAVSAPAGGGQ
eukprot:733469-Pelagomonas_calceolata.AAC.1